MERAKQCDDLEAEELIRISNLPRKHREKAWKSLKRKTDVPSHTAPMWRDVSHACVFDGTSANGMFEQIFEIMMEEHDGCDVEEYELMVEQFNLFAGRVAPTMIELLISVRHWVPLNQALVLDDDNLF